MTQDLVSVSKVIQVNVRLLPAEVLHHSIQVVFIVSKCISGDCVDTFPPPRGGFTASLLQRGSASSVIAFRVKTLRDK